MSKAFKITILSIMLASISLAWGRHPGPNRPLKKQLLLPDTGRAYDAKLFGQYLKLYKKFDTVRANYSIAGTINVHDPVDSSGDMKNIPFLFCKRGAEFYYRLGVTETLNAGGKYVFIDNGAREIVVSVQKMVQVDQSPVAMADLGKSLHAEHYQLSSATAGVVRTIAFTNEHNAGCKQFSISYDTLTNTIRELKARMTNLRYPLRDDKDKRVKITFSAWTQVADLGKYAGIGNMLKQERGSWKVVNSVKYQGYKVINE
jgi:hypothetical protein